MSEEGSSKKKKIILIGGLVIGFILVAALAVGGTLFFLGGQQSDEDLVNAKPGAAKSTSYYYSFEEPFTIPLSAASGKQRFMRISLAAKSKDASLEAVLDRHATLVRARLLTLFTNQQYKTMQTPEGKLQLQLEARRVVQEIVEQEGKQVDEILITDFVMQ